MRYRLCATMSILLLCLTGGASPLSDEHSHSYDGEQTCGAWQTVFGSCQIRTCSTACSYPACNRRLLERQERGECQNRPGAMQHPGPGPGGAGHTHDWGDEQCGPWSEVREGCEWRWCDRQCRTCHTNGQTRTEKRGPNC